MYEVLAILGLIFFIFAMAGIVLYIIYAYSLYKMAVNQGLENPWIAWIPIAQNYTLGKLIKTLNIFDYKIPRVEIVLPVATLIVLVLNRIPIISTLLSLANFILILFALNKLYKIYKPENATLYTVLSIFGIPIPFIFLSIKDLEQK